MKKRNKEYVYKCTINVEDMTNELEEAALHVLLCMMSHYPEQLNQTQ